MQAVTGTKYGSVNAVRLRTEYVCWGHTDKNALSSMIKGRSRFEAAYRVPYLIRKIMRLAGKIEACTWIMQGLWLWSDIWLLHAWSMLISIHTATKQASDA